MRSIPFLIFFMLIFLTSMCYAETLKLTDAAPAFYIEKKSDNSWIFMPYDQYDIEERPYVNFTRLELAKERFKNYTIIQHKNGYDAVAVGELQRVVTFERLGVLKEDSAEMKRAEIYKDFIMDLAALTDMKIFVTADFQPINPFIEDSDYSTEEINVALIEELLQDLPVDGLIIRFGEGGDTYSSGSVFSSRLMYDKPEDIQRLLTSILPIFQRHNKTLIVRSWSVGLGEIGDISYDPETYEKTFKPFYNESNLLVSIKYGNGDFWYHVDDNPTIGKGGLPQLVEYQIRREYEGYGLIANFLSPYYGESISRYRRYPQFAGIYTWDLVGGWDNASSIPYFSPAGYFIEIDNHILPEYLHGTVDLKRELDDHLSLEFEGDVKEELKEFLLDSGEIIRDIYYVSSYAGEDTEIKGVPIPPLLWIFWDIPQSSHFTLIHITKNTENILAEIDGTSKAYDRFQQHRKDILPILENSTPHSRFIRQSLRYEDKLLKILVDYKASFLLYYGYLDTGNRSYLNKMYEYIDNLDDASDEFNMIYEYDDVFDKGDLSEIDRFTSSAGSLPLRRWINVGCTFVFMYIAILGLLRWRRKLKDKIWDILILFSLTSVVFMLSLIHTNIYLGFVFLAILLLAVSLNHMFYRLTGASKRFRSKEHALLTSISSISMLLALINIFVFRFVTERIWVFLYELVFASRPEILLVLFLFLIYYIYKLAFLQVRKKSIPKILVSDILTVILMAVIIWQLFAYFFPALNELFNLFPSVLHTHGVGKEMINQLKFI
mgnify:CR=1 FL=1